VCVKFTNQITLHGGSSGKAPTGTGWSGGRGLVGRWVDRVSARSRTTRRIFRGFIQYLDVNGVTIPKTGPCHFQSSIYNHSTFGRHIVSVNEDVLKSTTKIKLRQQREFGIATTLQAGRSKVRTSMGAGGFLFSTPVYTSPGAQPPSFTTYKGLYAGDKVADLGPTLRMSNLYRYSPCAFKARFKNIRYIYIYRYRT
jgi:hypothetical protein